MGLQETQLTVLDGEWEAEVKELAKNDPLKAYDETQRVLCKQVCDRKDCNQDCAFVRRVIRHIIIMSTGGKLQ